jgi:hypothetical protein
VSVKDDQVVDHGLVDDVGESVLEATEDFAAGLAGCSIPGEVVSGAGLVAALGDGDDVEGS